MTRPHRDNRAALAALIASFQPEVQRLAFAIAREILTHELDRKRSAAAAKMRAAAKTRTPVKARAPVAAAKPRAPAKTRATRPVAAAGKRPPSAPAQQELALATAPPLDQPAAAGVEQAAAAAPQATGADEQKSAGAQEKPSALPVKGKRGRWTRESIIHELASWMSGGTAIDAVFVQRYGPPGLVAATRRVFGRFDAALNVASLHRAKLNEANPPPERTP